MHTPGSAHRLSTCAVALLGLAAGCSSTGQATSPAPASSAPAATASASAAASGSGSATPSTSPTAAPATPVRRSAPPASASPAGSRAAGLVRIQVNNCKAMASGTGFFVDDDLVLTAAHLFEGAASVAVHSPGGVVRGKVLGADSASDVALVQLLPTGDGSRLIGPSFTLGAAPTAGERITMLGHPVNRSAHRAGGTVEALDQQVRIGGQSLAGLFSHTANAAPGDSGGPLLDGSNRVVGMEVTASATGEGPHHGVPAPVLASRLKAWQAKPAPVTMAKCPELGPPSMTSIHPDAPAIKTALGRFLWGLSYPEQTEELTGLRGAQVAWQGLDREEQQRQGSPEKFLARYKGVIAGAANVDNLGKRDEFTDTLIWTVQLEGPGKKCEVRKQQVVLSSASGSWVIDEVTDLGRSSCG